MKYTVLSLIASFCFAAFSTNADAQLKKRIAVSRFDDRSGSGYNHVGVGVADMLTTALVKSGKFVVIERAEFDKVLEEQKLGQSGVVTPESAPKVGKALGVELLVIGSVSEFGTKQMYGFRRRFDFRRRNHKEDCTRSGRYPPREHDDRRSRRGRKRRGF